MVHLLITSPEGYAGRLQRAFEESERSADFYVVSRPMIRTKVAVDTEECRDFIQHLDEYDYVAFSSRKAIEAFALALQHTGRKIPSDLGLCAIGKDSELLVESFHRFPVFISSEPSPMGIVRHFEQFVEAQDKRIAVLAPCVKGMEEPPIVPNFIRGLEGIGMRPTRISVYETEAASADVLATTARQVLNGDFDAVVFTSGTEIKVFLQMVPEGITVEEFLNSLTVICYGPYTASCAEQYGVKVDFVSPSFGSFQELVEQIEKFYYR